MKTEHTPGPWRVGKTKEGDCRIYSDSCMHAIARTYGPDLNGIGVCALTGPKNKADARLIAAAPDLLAALKGILAVASVRIDDPRIDQWVDAQRAIAKAEGGAP